MYSKLREVAKIKLKLGDTVIKKEEKKTSMSYEVTGFDDGCVVLKGNQVSAITVAKGEDLIRISKERRTSQLKRVK